LKYLVSFRSTLKVSRYLFRALALVLWLLIALFSVFYIVNALRDKESEIRQEFNLSADQAQRYIQRTSDVMKELKYIAENRLTAENGILASRGLDAKTDVPDFQPLFPDSDCSKMGTAWRGSLESLAWFMRYWRDNFSAAYDLNRVFLIGSENLCVADFGLRDVPVERDETLKSLHERILKYRNAPQDERGNNLYWMSQGPRPGVGYFYALTPVYLGNRLQALLGTEQSIRMENFFTRAACRWA
jgi:two-component system capsular synthesis sensor histidine kinase RcsC